MKTNKGGIMVPISIVIAGLIVAGAVFLTNNDSNSGSDNNQNSATAELSANPNAVKDVDQNDWVFGNRDAQIKIVEYSDTECPFCGRLHNTLKEVIAQYDGKVAWVYRHLPIVQLHSKAVIEAHATECAGELGGNDGFWNYINRLYEITPANDGLDLAQLPKIAEFVGINVDQFNACQEEGRHQDKIQEDFNNALEIFGQRLGTPASVIILDKPLDDSDREVLNQLSDSSRGPDGNPTVYTDDEAKNIIVSGAHPFATWQTIIDLALN